MGSSVIVSIVKIKLKNKILKKKIIKDTQENLKKKHRKVISKQEMCKLRPEG